MFKIFYDYNKGNVEKFDSQSSFSMQNNKMTSINHPTVPTVPTVIDKINEIDEIDKIKDKAFFKSYNSDAKILTVRDVTNINNMIKKDVLNNINKIEIKDEPESPILKYPIFAPLPNIRYQPISKVGPFTVLDNIDYYKQIDIN